MFKSFFLITLIAGLLCILGYVPFVNPQPRTLVSKFVKNDLPKDPMDPAWNKIRDVIIKLGSQIVVKPRTFDLPKGKSSVRWVSVRSLNNGKDIAFRLEWKDDTENSVHNEKGPYRDAAALQFPLKITENEAEYPFFAMGHQKALVNIWYWKADLEGRRDRAVAPKLDQSTPKEKGRRGSVEDLNAEGFEVLILQDSQDVMGKGLWSDGRWRVVFWRPIITPDKDDSKIKRGTIVPIAFAVWDGSNLEKRGQKSISPWHKLKIE